MPLPIRSVLTGVALALSVGQAAAAQRIALAGGFADSNRRLNQGFESSVGPALSARWLSARGPFELQGEAQYLRAWFRGDGQEGDQQAFGASLNLVARLLVRSRISPYALVGLGFSEVRTNFIVPVSNEFREAFQAGFGVDFSVGGFRPFAESRWVTLGSRTSGRDTYYQLLGGIKLFPRPPHNPEDR